MLAINGIPLFYMELAIGQYLSLGTVGAWTALCPIARGMLNSEESAEIRSQMPRSTQHHAQTTLCSSLFCPH